MPSIATNLHHHASLIFLLTAQSDSDFYLFTIEANASIVRNGKEHKEAATWEGVRNREAEHACQHA